MSNSIPLLAALVSFQTLRNYLTARHCFGELTK